MWKKDETQAPTPAAPSTRHGETSTPSRGGSVRATIGPSITIRGDVTGSEDLLIEGHVDGSVTLELHEVTVGSEGRVKADITSRVITIEGKVEGDLKAQEQIVLRATAHVSGDLKAPRLVLEDGATFRGLVDMTGAKSEVPATSTGSEAKADAAKSSPDMDQVSSSDNGAAGSKGSGTARTHKGQSGASKRATI